MKGSAKRPTEATSAIDGFMRDKVVDFVSWEFNFASKRDGDCSPYSLWQNTFTHKEVYTTIH